MADNKLNRRTFIQGAGAAITLSALPLGEGMAARNSGIIRVGLIGAGWYGKSDLFRLIQVRDVDVVALCDVDANQLKEAGKLVSERQASGKVPALYATTGRCWLTINSI